MLAALGFDQLRWRWTRGLLLGEVHLIESYVMYAKNHSSGALSFVVNGYLILEFLIHEGYFVENLSFQIFKIIRWKIPRLYCYYYDLTLLAIYPARFSLHAILGFNWRWRCARGLCLKKYPRQILWMMILSSCVWSMKKRLLCSCGCWSINFVIIKKGYFNKIGC